MNKIQVKLTDTPEMAPEVTYTDAVKNLQSVHDLILNAMKMYKCGRGTEQVFTQMLNYDECRQITSLFMRDEIVNYRLQMARKNNKKLTNDPRQIAFLDMSDCLINEVQDEGHGILPGTTYYKDMNNIAFDIPMKDSICIPFTECFISTCCLTSAGMSIRLKDRKDGTYEGDVWFFYNIPFTVQLKLVIYRHENDWRLRIVFPLGQKPLGQTVRNVDIIFAWAFACMSGRTVTTEIKDPYGDIVVDAVYMIVLMIHAVFKYLNAYKSKALYKVSNEDNLYVYTSRQQEEIEGYIKKTYPNHTMEKQDGWLVNGFWKLLDQNEYGLDQQGKRIKGLDWYVPYNTEEKQVAQSGKQETNLIINHAIKRAKERYNVNFTSTDLFNIAELCKTDKAVKLSVRDKFGRLNKKENKFNRCYRVCYNNKYYDVVANKDRDGIFRVVTFLPKPQDVNYTIINCKDYNEVFGS